jgi:hypothetical protein
LNRAIGENGREILALRAALQRERLLHEQAAELHAVSPSPKAVAAAMEKTVENVVGLDVLRKAAEDQKKRAQERAQKAREDAERREADQKAQEARERAQKAAEEAQKARKDAARREAEQKAQEERGRAQKALKEKLEGMYNATYQAMNQAEIILEKARQDFHDTQNIEKEAFEQWNQIPSWKKLISNKDEIINKMKYNIRDEKYKNLQNAIQAFQNARDEHEISIDTVEKYGFKTPETIEREEEKRRERQKAEQKRLLPEELQKEERENEQRRMEEQQQRHRKDRGPARGSGLGM